MIALQVIHCSSSFSSFFTHLGCSSHNRTAFPDQALPRLIQSLLALSKHRAMFRDRVVERCEQCQFRATMGLDRNETRVYALTSYGL